MTGKDPYKVLGVSPDASDSEIKRAYKELVKKYHPDKYQDNPLSEIAEEKMAEINEAYDEIMEQRRGGGKYGNYYESDSSYSGSSSGSYASGMYNSVQIRNLIQSGSVTQAEQALNSVPMDGRDAEWHFLMGSVFYKRGWLNDAYTQFATAVQMNPQNAEYQSAFNQMNRQRNGNMAGNPMNNSNMQAANTACNCCGNLICADCCCEACGGDLIPCC